MKQLGIGVGLRQEMFNDIEELRKSVDFVEINAPRRLTEHLRQIYGALRENSIPIVVHSIGLSLGTDFDFATNELTAVCEVSDFVDAPWVSEHLSFSNAGEISLSSFIPLPYTEEAIEVVSEKIRKLKSAIGRPVLVENITHSMRWPTDEMSESMFIHRVLERGDCGLRDCKMVCVNS